MCNCPICARAGRRWGREGGCGGQFFSLSPAGAYRPLSLGPFEVTPLEINHLKRNRGDGSLEGVAMDMSASYEEEVRQWCPNARIVYDLFRMDSFP